MNLSSFFKRASNGIRRIGAPVTENLRKIGAPITNARPVGNRSNSVGARSFSIPSMLESAEKGMRTVGHYSNRGVDLYKNLTENNFIPDSSIGRKAVGVLGRLGKLA
jgi:hypothetical protein